MDYLQWEQIGQSPAVFRSKIYGGWLVRLSLDVMTPMNTGYDKPEMLQGYEWRESITFVPDKNHEWEIDKNKEG